jgi:hypothetical protein
MRWVRRWEIPGGPGEMHRVHREYWNSHRAYNRTADELLEQGRYDEMQALERPSTEGLSGPGAAAARSAHATAAWRCVVGIPPTVVLAVTLAVLLAPWNPMLALGIVATVASGCVLGLMTLRDFRRHAEYVERAVRR